MDRSLSSSVMSSSLKERSRLLFDLGVAVLDGATARMVGGSALSSGSDSGMNSLQVALCSWSGANGLGCIGICCSFTGLTIPSCLLPVTEFPAAGLQ